MGRKEECHIRIKKAMNLRGLTQSDIVEKTNIKKSALSQYINGKITPRQNAIGELAKILNVSEPWLMGYDVPMERNITTPKPEAPPVVDTSVLTAEELAEFEKVTQTNKLLFFHGIEDDDHDMAVFKNLVIDILLKQRKKKEEE